MRGQEGLTTGATFFRDGFARGEGAVSFRGLVSVDFGRCFMVKGKRMSACSCFPSLKLKRRRDLFDDDVWGAMLFSGRLLLPSVLSTSDCMNDGLPFYPRIAVYCRVNSVL